MTAESAETAARELVTRSPQRTVGIINCPWFQDKPIQHESRLEKHFVYRAMLFPGLLRIRHQPFTLKLQGRSSYTPDFLLVFRNGQGIVVEVKRAEKVKALKERFDEITQALAVRELSFFVIHHGQIEGDFRAQRALLIRRYAPLSVPPAVVARAVEFVAKHPNGVAIEKLTKAAALSKIQVYHLLARRHIAVAPSVRLTPDDLIYPISQEVTDANNQFGSWFGAAQWRTHA